MAAVVSRSRRDDAVRQTVLDRLVVPIAPSRRQRRLIGVEGADTHYCADRLDVIGRARNATSQILRRATEAGRSRSRTTDSATPGPPAPPPGAGLTIAEFRRRYEAGELSLARWQECSISPAEVGGLTADPHSAEYAAAVLHTWTAITGRDAYDAVTHETFPLDDGDFLARPYPYSSSDPTEISRYMGAVASAIDRVGGGPPRRIVEYGSGWGHLALALAATGHDVTAVDLNPASVDLLRRRSRLLGVELEVVECGFLDHQPDKPADTIVFFESFHHCERPFDLLDRCADQLTDGGRLLFLADAIYDHFYAPWGVRLDGAAAFMAAQQGWLELGFRRDFFEAELIERGFTVAWEVLPWLGPYGTVLVADRQHAAPANPTSPTSPTSPTEGSDH